MAVWLDGLGVFLQAVGITALLWLAASGLLWRCRVYHTPVRVVLSGDCPELEALLRSLRDWRVVLCDGGLTPEGLARARRAARNTEQVTFEEENRHGGENDH